MQRTPLHSLARALTVAASILGRVEAGEPQKAGSKSVQELLVHVGGTMRPAMEEIAKLFEKETGWKVSINYNDSGSLMAVIETTGKGDIYVPHDPFPAAMQKKGLVDRAYTVAVITPVIVVRKGNPKKIASIRDLAREDVKVGLPDPQYSTTGHIVPIIFRKAGIAEAMAKKHIARARGGGEIANAVKIGTVDAGIVWNAVAYARRDALDAIPIEPLWMPEAKADAVTTATFGVIDNSCVKVVVMTLKNSPHLEAARKLAELAASERGRAIFAKHGFSPAPSP